MPLKLRRLVIIVTLFLGIKYLFIIRTVFGNTGATTLAVQEGFLFECSFVFTFTLLLA